MNKRLAVALSAVLVGSLFAMSAAVAQGTPTINRWVISGGGAPSSGGNVTLNDTFGQPIIGPSSSGNVWLGAGYWGAGAVEEGPPPPPPIPVGGYIVPISKLKLLVPWMGLVALVGLLVTGTVVVLRRRARR
jgi:hypothetical protein